MSTLDRDSRYWKQGLAQSCKFLRPSGQSKKLGATVKKKSDPTSSESPTLSLFWLPCWCRQLESSLMGGSGFCTSEGLSSLRSGEEEDTCQQCFRGSRGAHLVNSCISGGLLSNEPTGLPVTLITISLSRGDIVFPWSTVSGLINARIWDWGAEKAIRDPQDTVKPLSTPSGLQMGRLCGSCFLSSPATKSRVLTSCG